MNCLRKFIFSLSSQRADLCPHRVPEVSGHQPEMSVSASDSEPFKAAFPQLRNVLTWRLGGGEEAGW